METFLTKNEMEGWNLLRQRTLRTERNRMTVLLLRTERNWTEWNENETIEKRNDKGTI